MRSLNATLEENGEQWTSAAVKIRVSYGVCGFESLKELGPAIERADQAMYGSRHRVRNPTAEMKSKVEPAAAFSLESQPG